MNADEGRVDVTDTYSGTLELLTMTGTDFCAGWKQTGVRRSNVPGGAFDRMSLRAIGLLWCLDGVMHGRGAWEFLDADGAKVFAVSERTGDSIRWRFTGGTGKYDRLSGEGDYNDFVPYPTIVPGHFQQSPVATGHFRLDKPNAA
jgi:hypothetical protein